MKNSFKQILLLEITMFLVIIVSFFTNNIFTRNWKLLFLFVMTVISIMIFKLELKNDYESKQILKTVLIYVLIYFILSYLAGLFIGFNKTVFRISKDNFIFNIIPTAIYIVLSEILRYIFIKKSNKNLFIMISSCILFICVDIMSNIELYNFSISDELYEFIGMVILVSIAKNIFMTILVNKSNYYNTIIYRFIMELYEYIVPIVPAFGPYLGSVVGIAFPLILALVIIKYPNKKHLDKPMQKHYFRIVSFIITIILGVLVLLNTGLLKYQMFVIGSNSMVSYMYKGDVIIVKKAYNEEKNEINKGEILVFKRGGKIISHRVHYIEKRNGTVYYKTKGDNNSQPDEGFATKSEIIGTVSLRIKYVGLPSIWIQELLR